MLRVKNLGLLTQMVRFIKIVVNVNFFTVTTRVEDTVTVAW
jgi:hypothetical protein